MGTLVQIEDAVRVEIADPGSRKAVEEAIAAASKLHRLPAAAPVIPVRDDDLLPWDGHYAPDLIRIHPSRPRPRLAFLHELGHYLDDLVFRTDDSLGSARFLGWRTRVLESDAILHLRAEVENPSHHRAVAHLTYLLRFSEAFARSYAQWVVLRSGEAHLGEELGDAIAALNYGDHWGNDDFQPIALELDEIFKVLR